MATVTLTREHRTVYCNTRWIGVEVCTGLFCLFVLCIFKKNPIAACRQRNSDQSSPLSVIIVCTCPWYFLMNIKYKQISTLNHCDQDKATTDQWMKAVNASHSATQTTYIPHFNKNGLSLSCKRHIRSSHEQEIKNGQYTNFYFCCVLWGSHSRCTPIVWGTELVHWSLLFICYFSISEFFHWNLLFNSKFCNEVCKIRVFLSSPPPHPPGLYFHINWGM